MSKDFDTTLSDAIDLASRAAHTSGATAARIRGRERTMRKRIVISTTSFVLVAAGAGAAFAVTSQNGGLPHPTAASPSSTASQTATAKSSPSSTPTTSTSASGSPGTSGAASSTTPSGSTSGTTASEHWLTAAQLPYESTMNWSANSPISCAAGSFAISDLYPGGCSEHTIPTDPHPAQKMDTVVFGSTGVPTGNGAWAGTTADQEFYTYASAAGAQSAFQYITQSILGEDSSFAGDRDASNNLAVTSTTTETAHSSGAVAIDSELRDSNGKPAQLNGNPGDASDRHYFFAVKGNIVEMLVIKGGPSVSVTANDASYLQTVINALS